MADPPVKERLLEAALVCLRRKGFAATSARDVAAEADANLRSIGYHYGSVRGLLLAAISENWRRWLVLLIRPGGDLAAGMRRFAEALDNNGPIVGAWLEAVAASRHDEDLRRILAANQAGFRERLARTLADAGHDEPEVRAAAIITVCDGAVVRHLLHGAAPPPTEIACTAAAAFADG